jgi:hypothetical protein
VAVSTKEWGARVLTAVGLWAVALEQPLSAFLDPALSGGFHGVAGVAFGGALVLWALEQDVPWKARAADVVCSAIAIGALVVRWTVPADKLDVLPPPWLLYVAALPLLLGTAVRSEAGVPTARVAVLLGGVIALIAGAMQVAVNFSLQMEHAGPPVLLGVLLLADYVGLDRQRVGETVGSRPFQYGSGAFVLVALAGVLAIGSYALAERNDKTWDLTGKGTFTLSDQARRVASELAFDVQVTAFFRATVDGRAEFEQLIDRFREVNPRITVEYVDPLQEPRRAEQADVTGEHGTILLTGNGRDRRLEWEVTEDELVRALVLLASTEEHPVCWSLGHGEPDPDDEFSEDGLGSVRLELEGLNYKVRKLEVTKTGIDRACHVLVIARPTIEWFPYEREALAAYVAEGGRVLLLIDAGDVPELAGELERFGVMVGEDFVIDLDPKNQMLGVADPSFLVLSAENFGTHAITRNMGGALVMRIARSVRAIAEPPAGLEVQDFVRTGPDAWGETDMTGETVNPDPGIEVVGAVPVMAVVEVKDPAALRVIDPEAPPVERLEGAPDPTDLARGVPADFAPKAGGRVVVIGDTDFPANRFLVWGNNRDLFLNSVAWLVEEEDQIGERPEQGETLEVSLAGQGLWCLVSVVFVPGLTAAAAMATMFRRRYL